MQFDMNRTWSQAVTKVRSNFQLLALISGVFMLVPSLVALVAMPGVFSLALPEGDAAQAEQRLQAILPSFFATMGALLLISLIGYAAMVALVGRERPTVGSALGRALKAMPSLIGSFLVSSLAYLAMATLAALLVTIVLSAGGALESTGGATALVYATLLFTMLYCMSRFSLILPVVVLDAVGNPLAAVARSWRMTKPAKWRIFAFFGLLCVAYFAIVAVVSLLFAAVGLVGGGSTFLVGIVTGILGMIASMLISAILASMHDQLSGGPGERAEPV